MHRSAFFVLCCAAITTPAWATLTFEFDYTYDTNGFFASNPAAKTALTTAASRFTGFTDNLTAVANETAPGGNQSTWSASFYNPADPYGDSITVNGPSIAANTLRVYVGGASLGGSTLGLGGPGGYGYTAYTQSFADNVKYRGQSGAATNSDFGPWGGSMSFDTTATWYYGTGTPGAGQSSFLAVAEHELAHLLGFGTADSWTAQVSGGRFTGATATSIHGSNPFLDAGSDYAHWLDGTSSFLPTTGIPQETAMDPSITLGTFKDLTVLDYAGLKDIGWQVPQNLLSVPEPGSIAMAAGSITLFLSRRRRAPRTRAA